MLLRLLTSLNWLIGTLALGGALLYPFIDQALISGGARFELKDLAEKIEKGQGTYYQTNQQLHTRYLFFSAQKAEMDKALEKLEVKPASSNFLVDARPDDRNALVIRAYTAPDALAAGHLPLMYLIKVAHPGEHGTGEWESLSGQKPGLLAALRGMLAALGLS